MRPLHRTASIIAGFYTLLQSILYSVITIYGCSVYTCLAAVPFDAANPKNKVSDLLYLAYFKGSCRVPAGEVIFPGESSAAERTYLVLIVYGIASAIWIPTSTLLVVASVSRVKGKNGALMFYPWIFNTLVMILMDLAGGIWYATDILKTMTVADFIKFIGSTVGPRPADFDGISVIPSCIMVGFFTRGIILWIINIILFGVVIQASRDVKKTFSTSEFIRGSAPRGIQKQLEKEAESKIDEPIRWVRVRDEVVLPRLDTNLSNPPPTLPQNPREHRTNQFSSPQSPIGEDAPSPLVKRRASFRRTGSSPVFDVLGAPTGETFPFPQDPNRRYVVNNPPASRFHEIEAAEMSREERARDMEREREEARKRDRDMAIAREIERERQDQEFQMQRARGDCARRGRRCIEWHQALDPKYDKTMRPRPEAPPKPEVPPPDYNGAPNEGRSRWNPQNLSRGPSNAADRGLPHFAERKDRY
ncbi:Hypothetical protein NTJ_10912 [Nesidiocoris tenuis]|uniref:Uncharacterized protein n=1 Tax=Nesidiocoris tenuis TaxID=355587 RepID=A0ABN7B0Z2_9HEMI|nr:Hypothetical protein NTJ_10912 [Nesidiocoris tenuis]